MAHVSTQYIVYNHGGTGVRHHHFSSANDIISATDDNYPGSSDSSPGTHTCYGFALSPDTNQYPFAFMAVAGNVGTQHLFTSPGNPVIEVGSNNVTVLVVYGPKGGTGNGGPGVWVDAFNLDVAAFSDDLHFITVLTPPTPPDTIDNTKTNWANQDGSISTVTAEHFRSSQNIDGSAQFVEWKQILAPSSITNSHDVDVAKGESNQIWFAFYQTPPPLRLPKIDEEMAVWIYLSPGVLVGGGGFGIRPGGGGPIPIDPNGPFMRKLLTTFGILSLATNMSAKDKEQAIKLAASHLETIKNSILKMEGLEELGFKTK